MATPPPPSGQPTSYSASPPPPPVPLSPTPSTRSWWQKKRYAIPAGLFALFFLSIVGLAAIGSTIEPETESTPSALALAEPDHQQSPTTSETPASTTTQAPTTTTQAPTTTEAPTTTTTQAPETISFECGGEIIELPAGDDSDLDALCESLQQIVWIDGMNSQLPVVADWARATDSWDAYEEAGRSMCPWAAEVETESEFGLQLLLIWNSLDENTQWSFDSDIENFALFSGISIGAFCPGHLPS